MPRAARGSGRAVPNGLAAGRARPGRRRGSAAHGHDRQAVRRRQVRGHVRRVGRVRGGGRVRQSGGRRLGTRPAACDPSELPASDRLHGVVVEEDRQAVPALERGGVGGYAAPAGSQAARPWGAMADRACEFENGRGHRTRETETGRVEGRVGAPRLRRWSRAYQRQWARSSRMPSACTTCWATSRNGSRTATTNPTWAPRRTVAPGQRPIVPGAHFAAAIGATLRVGV